MEDTILSKKLSGFLNKKIREARADEASSDYDVSGRGRYRLDAFKEVHNALRLGDFDDLNNMSIYATERRKAKRKGAKR